MAWFYDIRDPRDVLIERVEGFRTSEEAMNAGIVERDRLASTGNIPGSGVVTVTTGQDSQEPWR